MDNNQNGFSKRSWIIVIVLTSIVSLLVGFYGGVEYKTYQVRKVLEKATQEISNVFPSLDNINTTETVQDSMKKGKVINKNIGDEVQLATLKFKVNSVEEKNIINCPYGEPKVAQKDTKFVLVNLDMTNTTSAEFYMTDFFTLIDSNKREYTEYNQVSCMDDSLLNKPLSPSIVRSGVLVYQIPTDATSYNATVGKAGTDEYYQVKLK